MDSLSSLNAFVRSAEARSFTAAAQQLGISSSAVGKAIARLEERLAVRLFHRSTRTMTLTPEGRLFLERCRRILDEVDAAEAEIAQTRGAPRGKLRISLPLAGMLMMPTLSAFMHEYPEVELDLDFTDRLVDIVNEQLDGAVRAGENVDSRLMSRTLGKFHFKLVASPAYLSRTSLPATPEDLSSHSCLHHRFATNGRLEEWPLVQSRDTFDLPISAVANTIEPLIFLAEMGHGIACLPDFAIRRQLASGSLVAVLDQYVCHTGTFRMLWPSRRFVAPKLRVFIDFMAERLFAA
jgi:DNA-binding transcriptional LysR family regulator